VSYKPKGMAAGPFYKLRFIDPYYFFEKHNTNADTHTRTSTHPYKHTHVHPTPMSTSERLGQFDLEIHEVDHQERLAVNGDVASH
jgi:hypothetical protein